MKKQEKHYEFPSNPKNMFEVTEVGSETAKDNRDIEYPCYMFLDQSTKTGLVVVDDKRRLVLSMQLDKEEGEELHTYKEGLKDELKVLIDEYKVKNVWHEETYDKANHQTTEVLYYIKHMIGDLAYEFDRKIEVLGIDHARWKSLLAKPKPWKKGQNDKKQVEKFVKEYYPVLDETEHIMDALGMMIALIWKNKEVDVRFNARINKNLPVFVEVMVVKEDVNMVNVVKGMKKKFREKLGEEENLYKIAYNIKHDEWMNARYFLHFKDGVCWAEIPYHRNIGQILLHNEIIPKEMKEDEKVVMVACRKK